MEFVHPEAELASDVSIGKGCIIEKDVSIGSGTRIDTGVIIKGGVIIGRNNEIHPYAVIGDTPQDMSYSKDKGVIQIGDNNIIREFVTIHGAVGKDERTMIGDHNYIMAYSHIAHNCKVGNHVLLVNGATLGGLVEVQDYAYISAFVPVHQWVRIGAYSIIGGGLRITKDLVPYALAGGSPLRVVSPNFIGLRRNGFSKERIERIKEAFRILFRSNLNTGQALKKLKEEFKGDEDIERIITFIKGSRRGIIKGG
ncbi:acyl-ACP--UDP-N-acetylglucosamine O-acyltransferase [candidate division WOR-3 bacterium]|nr:acyl-ACP--UDP-N-acetylglucosamine O-acyltransferase [candidate division WOR-3 bacterium]MCK4527260.1 acyl-ACP--UDP-N-acetylglucosamine O-acyltransferase [candidate division WOR-3 bacterium]